MNFDVFLNVYFKIELTLSNCAIVKENYFIARLDLIQSHLICHVYFFKPVNM